eukprot:Phypoly_transcript_09510.p1 GENE.Phypoly_transcript_09510~~Phypoly_transcript_09510.p1  ORF type:complete len:371 (+),score=55.16 Phypoly_transcript_09510:138-1250(+)
MATVVLSQQTRTQHLPPAKHDPTQAYLNQLWTKFLGNLSFIVVISFVFIPVAFTAFLFVYFGILQGIAFVVAVCAYNRMESKFHPLGETGRRWQAFIDFIGVIWEPFARMKQVKVVKLADDSSYSPNKQYMFAFHPHGILFLGPSSVTFSMDKHFPGITCSQLMSSSSFIAPIFRQFCIWIGGIPVTREAARQVVAQGSSLSLVPGGLAEMLLADPRPRLLEEVELEKAIVVGETQPIQNSRPRKTVALYMQKRKGFIKLALELGLDLVPVFTFGELENYHQVRWGLKWRMKVSRMLKLPLCFIYGKFGLVPFSEPMAVVFGKPIHMEQNKEPSEAVVDFYHKKYLEELSNIFEENKAKHGHADTRLIFM